MDPSNVGRENINSSFEVEFDRKAFETIYSELLLKENFVNFKKSERVYLEKIKNAAECVLIIF